MEKVSEGIVLHVIPFQDKHEIATLFGPEGKFSLIRKWGRGPKKIPLAPLTRAEFVWREGKGELGHLDEIQVLDSFLKLRDSLKSLQLSMECLSALYKTQQTNQPAERLYQLVIKILEALPSAPHPETLLSAFYLKLLVHEGLLPLEELTLEMAEITACRSLNTLSTQSLPKELHEAIRTLYQQSII